MTTQYYTDSNGNFLGAFVDGALPSVSNAIAVPSPPPGPQYIWQSDQWVEVPEPLETQKQRAVARVNGEAEALRRVILASGEGQMLSYSTKFRRAEEVLTAIAGGAVLLADDYPLLKPLIGVERHPVSGQVAADLQEVAQIIVDTGRQWEVLEGVIDAERRRATLDIAAASNGAAVQQIVDTLTWPTITP